MKINNDLKNSILHISLIFFLVATYNNVLSQEILPDDDNIHYVGRIDFSNPLAPAYQFPGISISAKFYGTGISATIEDDGTGAADKSNYYKILVDGNIITGQLKMESGENDYLLVSGLENAEHLVQIIKITEGYPGKSIFKGFTIEEGAQELLPFTSESADRKIEFIGDSWTSGFGNVSLYTTGPQSMAVSNYVAANQDNYYAWGPITARALNADHHVTAISGRGLYRNNTGSTTGTIPQNYDFIFEDTYTNHYDHHSWHPDVIVIHIGTNDMALEENGSANKMNDALFEKTYIDFISKLLTYHPCAQIIICFGNSKTDAWPTWTNQLSRLRTIANNIVAIHNKGNVHTLELPFTAEKWTGNPDDDCGYGDAWHPSKCSHEEMSDKLLEKINSININWGNQSNCPELADTDLWTSAQEEIKITRHVKTYPNPTQGKVYIHGDANEWQLLSTDGRVLMEGFEKEVDLAYFPTGVYLLKIRGQNSISFLKILKHD